MIFCGNMSLVAVVDDEKSIRDIVRIALEKDGHLVEEYPNGEAAWQSFRCGMPDLVILDIMMPRLNGLELCRKIREKDAAVPVIFLSSRDEEFDKVLGLEMGGDDYVCKPFGVRELTARVRVALRRSGRSCGPVTAAGPDSGFDLVEGPLEMNSDSFTVQWGGTDVQLTVTEFRILFILARAPGQVRTREQLMQAAFPDDSYFNDRAADSHIKRIRRKLKEAGADGDIFEAVYGLGYRFRAER